MISYYYDDCVIGVIHLVSRYSHRAVPEGLELCFGATTMYLFASVQLPKTRHGVV